MNRKNFLKNIGIFWVGLLLAPNLTFSASKAKSNVYRVKSPAFKINYVYSGQTNYGYVFVNTYNMSEEELINKYLGKEIFIYSSESIYIEGLGERTYTRCWVNQYDDIKILSYSRIDLSSSLKNLTYL